jgi:hypothetical protein
LRSSPWLDRREANIVAAMVMFLGRARGDRPFSNVALGRNPNRLIGEIGVFAGLLRTASIKASTPVRLLKSVALSFWSSASNPRRFFSRRSSNLAAGSPR